MSLRNIIKSAAYTVLHMLLCAALFSLLAAGAILCMEAIWRGSFSLAVMWAARLWRLFGMLVLVTASLELALYMLTGRMLASVLLTNAVLTVTALVQHYKLALRGEVFVLSDVMLASEALTAAAHFTIDVPWYVVLGCILMLLMPLCVWGMRLKKHYLSRLAVLALCAVTIGQGWSRILIMNEAPTQELVTYYHLNGLLAGLVWSRPQAPKEPKDYSEEAVCALLSEYAQEDDVQVKPDILFVMSETLYDPGKLPGILLSEDPLAYMKTLQESHWGGELYVQSYGGGTAQTEYEVLTGCRVDYTSVSAYLDQTLVYDGMDSLASLLKRYGYYTMAMHPAQGSVYNREKAYRRMGFDETVFIEDMAPPYSDVGPYPSDRYLFEEIIRQYEGRPEDQPWFSFVVTYQNHGGYDYGYDAHGIAAVGSDGALMPNATTYANALRESDIQLQMLTEYFAARQRPVVLVIFGDHAPALSQVGCRQVGSSPEAQCRIHTTPLLIYSNYGLEMPEDTPRTLSAYRLGAVLLHALGFRSDAYYNYLADGAVPNLYGAAGWMVDQNGVHEDAEAFDAALEALNLIRYDRICGEQYGKGVTYRGE